MLKVNPSGYYYVSAPSKTAPLKNGGRISISSGEFGDSGDSPEGPVYPEMEGLTVEGWRVKLVELPKTRKLTTLIKEKISFLSGNQFQPFLLETEEMNI